MAYSDDPIHGSLNPTPQNFTVCSVATTEADAYLLARAPGVFPAAFSAHTKMGYTVEEFAAYAGKCNSGRTYKPT